MPVVVGVIVSSRSTPSLTHALPFCHLIDPLLGSGLGRGDHTLLLHSDCQYLYAASDEDVEVSEKGRKS